VPCPPADVRVGVTVEVLVGVHVAVGELVGVFLTVFVVVGELVGVVVLVLVVVGVSVGTAVAVAVSVAELVAVAVFVGVTVDDSVGVCVVELVCVGVTVWVSVFDAVLVGVSVSVGVCVRVAVFVRVGVPHVPDSPDWLYASRVSFKSRPVCRSGSSGSESGGGYPHDHAFAASSVGSMYAGPPASRFSIVAIICLATVIDAVPPTSGEFRISIACSLVSVNVAQMEKLLSDHGM